MKRVEVCGKVGGMGIELVDPWEPCWHEGTCSVELVIGIDAIRLR